VGGHLGPAVPGEDALLVAVDPHEGWSCREVREVPDVLAHDGINPVEYPVIGLEQCRLVLLAPQGAAVVWRPAMVSAPYSVTMMGLPWRLDQADSSASRPRSAASRSPGSTYHP